MKADLSRGEIWTATGPGDYAGKPRPVVIIQRDNFAALDSVTICGLTSDPTDLPLFRVLIEPSRVNGLEAPSRLMIDKIFTTRKSRLGRRIGRLNDTDVLRLNRAIATFLGLAN